MLDPRRLAQPRCAVWTDWALRVALQKLPLALSPQADLIDATVAARMGLRLYDAEAGVLIAPSGAAQTLDAEGFALLRGFHEPVLLDLGVEDPDAVCWLAGLAADGVLVPAGGGNATFLAMLPPWDGFDDDEAGPDRNLALSSEAVSFALDWHDTYGAALIDALYGYGRMPLPVPDPDAIEHAARRIDLATGMARREHSAYWLMWQDRTPRTPESRLKLYLSPAIEIDALPEILEGVGSDMGVAGMKIPAQPAEFRRPDFCVLYLSEAADPRRLAETLLSRMDGIEGRGVSFTAPLDVSGRLSWGVDPAAGYGSHRLLVARRIAGIAASIPRTADASRRRHDMAWRLRMDGLAGHGCLPVAGTSHVH